MPLLQDFPRHEMPPHLAAQIRSFVRIQWPSLNSSTQLWDYSVRTPSPRHFVLTDGELLISHACANERTLTHKDRPWRVAGLSTVFTYPDRRHTGFASQVVAAATQYILHSNADLALLFADNHLKKFYETQGWSAAPKARIFFGLPESPKPKTDNLVMTILISSNARNHLRQFLTEDFYVGESTW